ncbi:MAG: Uma2 family endonuclease, partial [Candidatus Tectomicrobia bacterium]|nr:Uma2 family endonuclease [Candidatus Tectomicrobia bacterium]
ECVEIMSPLPKHEAWADAVLRIVGEITRALGLKLETRGSMTMRSLWHRQGAEPDTCFYIQNATRIIGKETLDFSIDPPPDIVVEIDVTHVSTTKFSIYATLGVPEIWCYNGETMTFRVLMGTAYVIVLHSQALPLLPSTVIAQWIAVSKVEGQDAALDAVRAWVLAQSPQR